MPDPGETPDPIGPDVTPSPAEPPSPEIAPDQTPSEAPAPPQVPNDGRPYAGAPAQAR